MAGLVVSLRRGIRREDQTRISITAMKTDATLETRHLQTVTALTIHIFRAGFGRETR